MAGEPLDLTAITSEFLQQCGPHDFGVDNAGCNCPTRDYRPVMLDLVREVERLRALVPDPYPVRLAADIRQAERMAGLVEPAFRPYWRRRATELKATLDAVERLGPHRVDGPDSNVAAQGRDQADGGGGRG
jgi:hypothetical protein